MSTKLLLVAAIAAASSLYFDATEVQAQGRRRCNQGYVNNRQATVFYSNPVSQTAVYSNVNDVQATEYYSYPTSQADYSSSMYGVHAYAPYGGYSSGNRYRGVNRYRSGYGNYGRTSRGGFRIGF